MLQFEKDIILKTFLKCFGLRSALLKYVELNDSTMIDECIDSLGKQSGLRESFIRENLTEILGN
jgi:hypothetical protein